MELSLCPGCFIYNFPSHIAIFLSRISVENVPITVFILNKVKNCV